MNQSGRGKVVVGGGPVSPRTEHPQPHLLGQTFILFNDFDGVGIA